MADDQLPLLTEPLPPGQATIEQYAERIGRHPKYLRQRWMPRAGFPEPVGQLPGRGRNSGGLRRKVFEVRALDEFRASQGDLWGIPGEPVRADGDMPGRVTLGYFAGNIAHLARKTVTQYRGRPGFPEPDADGRYSSEELVEFFNARPRKRGPGRAPRRASSARRRAARPADPEDAQAA